MNHREMKHFLDLARAHGATVVFAKGDHIKVLNAEGVFVAQISNGGRSQRETDTRNLRSKWKREGWL